MNLRTGKIEGFVSEFISPLQNEPSQRVATFPQTQLSCSCWGLQMLHNREVLKVLSQSPSLSLAAPWSMQDLSSPTRDATHGPCSLNPWTTREAPRVPPAISEVHFPWHPHQHRRCHCSHAHMCEMCVLTYPVLSWLEVVHPPLNGALA